MLGRAECNHNNREASTAGENSQVTFYFFVTSANIMDKSDWLSMNFKAILSKAALRPRTHPCSRAPTSIVSLAREAS